MSAEPGRIILLNGATSSGKSTLARGLQAKIERPFWHISIDHLRDAGVLPLDRIRRGDFAWKDMREQFFAGFHASIAAYTQEGNDLIVEHIVETEDWMRRILRLLSGYDVFFVGVHCNLEELERRETERGDRPVGGARRDFETIHRYCLYDIEIDSTEPADRSVTRILEAWRARSRPSAFERMAANGPSG